MKKLILLASILFSFQASAQWSGAVLDSLTNDSSRDEVNHQCLDIDRNNIVHVVYKQENVVSGWNLFYKQRDASTAWLPTDTISHMAGNNVVVASSIIPGEAFVAFDAIDSVDGDQEIFICSNAGGIWNCQQLTMDTLEDMFPTIDVDTGGYIHMAWVGADSLGAYKIKYASNQSGSWLFQTISNSNLGQFGSGASPEIAVEPSGVSHIAYRGGDYQTYRVNYATNIAPGGFTWNIDTIITSNPEDLSVSITISNDTVVHLLVGGNWGFGFPWSTYYLKKEGMSNTFTLPVQVASTFNATIGDLVVDSMDVPHCVLDEISGNIWTGNVLYANQNNWAGQLLLNTGDTYQANLVLDTEGNGHLLAYRGAFAADSQEIVYYGPQTTVGIFNLKSSDKIINAITLEKSLLVNFLKDFRGTISCFSTDGKEVYSGQRSFSSGENLHIENLSEGIYILVAESEIEKSTLKVIVQ